MNCTQCATPNAYVGATSVECVNRDCTHFSQKWMEEGNSITFKIAGPPIPSGHGVHPGPPVEFIRCDSWTGEGITIETYTGPGFVVPTEMPERTTLVLKKSEATLHIMGLNEQIEQATKDVSAAYESLYWASTTSVAEEKPVLATPMKIDKCPFCGSGKQKILSAGYQYTRVQCTTCFTMGPEAPDNNGRADKKEFDAVRLWNRRP
jgi:hypothetical protein